MGRKHARKGGPEKDSGLEASPGHNAAQDTQPVTDKAAESLAPSPSSTETGPTSADSQSQPKAQKPRTPSPKKRGHSRLQSNLSPSQLYRSMSTSTKGARSDDIDGSRGTMTGQPKQMRSWYGLATFCVLLSVLSLVLWLLAGAGVDWLPSKYSRALSIAAVIAAMTAVPLTHGLAGVQRFGNDHYQFFQPFSGGFRYVVLQCLGWALYTVVLLSAVWILVVGVRRVAVSVVASVGLGGVLAQVLVLGSLHFYACASKDVLHRQLSQRQLTQVRQEKGKEQQGKESGARAVKQDKQERRKGDEPQVVKALTSSSGIVGLVLTIFGIVLASIVESANKSLGHVSHLSLQSLVTSALLFGVPLTHVFTGRASHQRYSLFQPFQGGWAFVLLQALGWTLWVLAVLSALTSIFLASHNQYVTGIISGAGVGGVIAQGMVLLSLKYFDSQLTTSIKQGGKRMDSFRRAASKRDLLGGISEEQEQKVEADTDAEGTRNKAANTLKRQGSLTGSGAPNVSLTHKELLKTMADVNDRTALGDLRGVLAKSMRFTQSRRRLNEYAERELEDRGEDKTDGEAGVKFDPSTLASLSWNQWRDALNLMRQELSKWDWQEAWLDLRCQLVVGVVYFVPTFGAMCAFTPFVTVYLFHDVWWVPPLMGAIVAYYVSTLRGRPGFTGKKSWHAFRHHTFLWGAFERYFHLNIITQGDIDETEGPVLMGFHPHGVYPLTTFWGTRGPSFRAAFPTLEVDVCGASVMFNCPVLREILLWSGGREVSAASIRHCLKQKRSILLVPGGQREMLHSRADPFNITYVTKHKGFVRMAIENGVRLVPVLSLGETFCLENIYVPSVQSWFLKYTGVGFPIFPFGRWYSPIANQVPITLVFGKPMEVEQKDEPTEEEVETMHKKYYDYVQQLFDEYKAEAGFPDQVLTFSDA